MIVRSRMRALRVVVGGTRRRREVFARYGVSIDPAATVADLRPVERALLAIVRAMEEIREVHDTDGLLVLDEPTVFLPRADTEQLFALVREIVAPGEACCSCRTTSTRSLEITERVTVLRDGHVVGTVVTADAAQISSSR